MPRQARKVSGSNVYHVMTRGINQVQLFYDDEDRSCFMRRLALYAHECHIELFAWCLMGNHFHILVRVNDIPLSAFMKKLLLSYSHYYNSRYDRQGYLYQGRYTSKPVETDAYFLSAIRYIHRNPLEIGNPITYWTSYGEYIHAASLVEPDLAFGILSNDREEAIASFRDLMENDASDLPEWSMKTSTHFRDADAIAMIRRLTGVSDCGEICSFDAPLRNEALVRLREYGLSIRQIARLTGLSKSIVEAAKP